MLYSQDELIISSTVATEGSNWTRNLFSSWQ